MRTLHLDTHWSCDYVKSGPDPFVLEEYDITVARLRDWQFDKGYSDDYVAWLERRFILVPTTECMQYFLNVEMVPSGTELLVNGRAFGAISTPLRCDITDYVALDENRIAFRVPNGSDGEFGVVRISAVPCEE